MTDVTSPSQNTCVRLALVISDLSSGGAQRVVMGLTTHWLGRGATVNVLTQSTDESDFFKLPKDATRQVMGGLGSSRTGLGRLISNLRRIIALRRAIRTSQANVVVAFLGQTIISTVLACWGLPVKVVACERNDPARQPLGWPWDLLRRWLYPRADIVTANSQTAIDAMAAYVPRQKLRLTPNAVPPAPDSTSARQAELAASTQFLAVGRLTWQKGYDILIKAFAMLPDDLTHWRLTILGDGPLLDELQNLAKEEMVAPRIHWAGVQADPFTYYRAGEIFVLASRHEGMPNVVLEAASVGLPVIVTDACAGALDVIVNDASGLVVPSEDPAAMADAMTRLARDNDLRSGFVKAAAARLERLQPQKVMAIWDQIVGLQDSGNT
jgi:GalNAc-alpha-(1->4)-GalNAc-alpha-(1->3)-diNAcBac-PP-undecaprenol alpha-1,4-N-acetyl-D-galactosaminyltransferase